MRTHDSLLHSHQSFIEESSKCRLPEISVHRSSCTRERRLERVSGPHLQGAAHGVRKIVTMQFKDTAQHLHICLCSDMKQSSHAGS